VTRVVPRVSASRIAHQGRRRTQPRCESGHFSPPSGLATAAREIPQRRRCPSSDDDVFFCCRWEERTRTRGSKGHGTAFEARMRRVCSRKPRSPASSTRKVGTIRAEVTGMPLTHGSRTSGLWRAAGSMGYASGFCLLGRIQVPKPI
jgi:hypothetical protein